MYRLPYLFVVAAILFTLAGCKYFPLRDVSHSREGPADVEKSDADFPSGGRDESAAREEEPPAPRFQEWPEKYRFPIHEPADDGKAVDISNPPPEVGEPDEPETPKPETKPETKPAATIKKDDLVLLVENLATTPESRRLIEAVLQTAGDRPDKAYALLKDDSLKDKKMLVNLLKAYVNYELGDVEKAMEILDGTFQELRSQMPMRVNAAEFCRKVQSYGKYEAFSQHVFRPSDSVILYFEPQYFTCKESGGEYLISLNVRYSIKNEEGKQVWQTDHSVNHSTTRYLYDLFLTQIIRLPSLPVGNYTLNVEVQDNLSEDQHRAESEVVFEVRNL